MRAAPFACCGLVAVLAGCGSVPPMGNAVQGISFPAATTVTYCNDGGPALTLDVLEPAQPQSPAPHPLLLIIHGGSWSFGDSVITHQGPLPRGAAAGLLQRGFVVASINYRLAPRDPWPAQIVDTRCAIRYLRATATRWNIDPHRFLALGNSAGGQLVSLAALSAGQEPQWDNGQYASESSALEGVVDLWGPVDLTAPGWDATAIRIGTVEFQQSLGSDSDTLRRASPVTYIHAGAPPFLIIQGSDDTLVPPAQAADIHALLVAAGDPASLIDVAHAGHELVAVGGPISPSLDSLTARVVSFAMSAA